MSKLGTGGNSKLDLVERAIQVLLNAFLSNLDPIAPSSLYNVAPYTFEKLGHTPHHYAPHPLLFHIT